MKLISEVTEIKINIIFFNKKRNRSSCFQSTILIAHKLVVSKGNVFALTSLTIRSNNRRLSTFIRA